MLLGAGGTAYLAQLTVTSGYPGDILPALIAMGLGFGMIFAPAINTATAGVPPQDSGVASALVNTMQQVGGSIGVSILSTIAGSATTSYLLPTTPARRRSRLRARPPTATPWPSRSRLRCSGSARSSRSSCCRPGAGSRN